MIVNLQPLWLNDYAPSHPWQAGSLKDSILLIHASVFNNPHSIIFIIISAYGTSNSTVIRQSTFNLCPLQMSVHYIQLLVMCNNYLLETFCTLLS